MATILFVQIKKMEKADVSKKVHIYYSSSSLMCFLLSSSSWAWDQAKILVY